MQHAADSKHCRNCGHAYEYEAIYLGHLGRYRCPNCGRKRPEPQVAATERAAARAWAARASRCARPQGELGAAPPAARPLQRLQRRGRGRDGARAGRAARHASARRWRASPAPSAASRRSRSTAAKLSILLIKNPAGANEVLRTLTLEDGELDLWIALNDNIADGRDVSWIWDADFEVLAGRVRRVTCSGTRAEEMALRLKYAGVDDRASRSSATSAPRSTRGRERGRRARLRAPHLHGAARAARPARGPRAREAVVRVTGSERDLARRRARLLRRRPAALARAGRRRPAVRSWTSARAPGRVALDLAAAATTWSRSTRDAGAARGALRDARAVGEHGRTPTRASFSVDAAVPAGHRADADRADPRRPPRQASPCFGGVHAHLSPWRPLRRRDCRPERRRRRRSSCLRRFPTSSSATAGCSRASPSTMYERGRRAWSIERLRQVVSPTGELSEEDVRIEVDVRHAGRARG